MKPLKNEELELVRLDWKRNAKLAPAARAKLVVELHALTPDQVRELMGEKKPEPPKHDDGRFRYAPETKKQAIEAVLQEGGRIPAVAQKYGINPGTLSDWCYKARREQEELQAAEESKPDRERPVPEGPRADPLVAMLESRLAELTEAGKMLAAGMTRLVQLGACPTDELERLREQQARLAAFAEGFESALAAVYAARKEDPDD